jgi:endogenous inhibitor of DNA gyrase (YacG/DUF329 family)
VANTRACVRCGRLFEPKREHARFCSARCRVAWNREHLDLDLGRWGDGKPGRQHDLQPQEPALAWAIIAMRDTTRRLGRVRPSDRPQAFAVIGEAVWWVTIVDAALVRYRPDAYDEALDELPGDECRVTEEMFTGLRFVRNRMGYHADHSDFIEPRRGADGVGDAPITAWTWKALPKPAVDWLPPRGQAWEMSRYRAYQGRLAGHTVGETFERTALFLTHVAETADRWTESAPAADLGPRHAHRGPATRTAVPPRAPVGH